jgi:hypothetical protein
VGILSTGGTEHPPGPSVPPTAGGTRSLQTGIVAKEVRSEVDRRRFWLKSINKITVTVPVTVNRGRYFFKLEIYELRGQKKKPLSGTDKSPQSASQNFARETFENLLRKAEKRYSAQHVAENKSTTRRMHRKHRTPAAKCPPVDKVWYLRILCVLSVVDLSVASSVRSKRSMRSMRGGFIFRKHVGQGPSLEVHCGVNANCHNLARNQKMVFLFYEIKDEKPQNCE